MSTFIKPGFWEEKRLATKHWLNLDQLITNIVNSLIPPAPPVVTPQVINLTTGSVNSDDYTSKEVIIMHSGNNCIVNLPPVSDNLGMKIYISNPSDETGTPATLIINAYIEDGSAIYSCGQEYSTYDFGACNQILICTGTQWLLIGI